MTDAGLEQMLDLLDVRLDAFATCEIGEGWRLACPGMERIVVHFVLEGEGRLEWEGGSAALAPGAMVVVPRHLAKAIAGPGESLHSADISSACPLPDDLVSFRARGEEAGLVLGCAAVSASLGDGFGLFDNLRAPLVEAESAEASPLLFQAILAELASPGIGTRAVVGTMMKQVLLLLLRGHFRRHGADSPLHMPLMHPQLGRAVAAILARPNDEHSVESLARLCGMSRSRFSHHFSATYGTSPMAFVQTARLRAGARLLRSTRMPVKAISATVGYASRSHFSRAFRGEFGIDPSAYRDGPAAGANDPALVAAE
ncbi:MAG TPA: AraC family transcriptional regulator [Allosphingosinicella sp.]|jgi:AraC-like DNA-binding protein